jgi:hypothetical protein
VERRRFFHVATASLGGTIGSWWRTRYDGCEQGSGAVWHHGGVNDGSAKVNALIHVPKN